MARAPSVRTREAFRVDTRDFTGFSADLKQARRQLREQVAAVGKQTVAPNILKAAQSNAGRYPVRTSAHTIGAKLAATLRVQGGKTTAALVMGNARAPFPMGAEFGSFKYTQFPPHLGRQGYFLWPAIRQQQAMMRDAYDQAVVRSTEKAFPK